MFKKISIMFAAIVTATFVYNMSASAADLPSRNAVPLDPIPVVDYSRFYVGVNGGMYASEFSTGTVGAVVGYNINPNIAVEVSYDYTFKTNDYRSNSLLLGNVIVGHKFGVVKPYVLAGAGYQFIDGVSRYGIDWNGLKDSGRAVYAVGGGVKFDIAQDFEVDARYRYVQGFESKHQTRPENRMTVGVNYKF